MALAPSLLFGCCEPPDLSDRDDGFAADRRNRGGHDPHIAASEALRLTGARPGTSTCPGCRAVLPEHAGTTHPYIGASPACWAVYTELLGIEHGGWHTDVHRLAVDAYAAQHPGEPARRQRQSVAAHLVGLCLALEHGADAAAVLEATRKLLAGARDFPWWDPPSMWRSTVHDVLPVPDVATYVQRVQRWGTDVWTDWAEQSPSAGKWVRRTAEATRSNN